MAGSAGDARLTEGRFHGPITPTHREASSTALQHLCEVVNAGSGTGDGARSALNICLTHLEDDGHLGSALLSVNLYLTDGAEHPSPYDGRFGIPPTEVRLHSSFSDPATPFRLAVVANQTTASQIEVVLETLGSVLQRQQLLQQMAEQSIADIDHRTAAADGAARADLSDVLRARGWRSAAEVLGARARAAGRPFRLTYRHTVFAPEELRQRAPVLRHVYNTSDVARREVDKVAAVLARTGRVESRGSELGGAFARRRLDVWRFRPFIAHAMRDALVCGNGYLSFGRISSEDVRLLPPEHCEVVGDGVVVVDHGQRREVHRDVLHLPGLRQFGSPYGMSVLEPYVGTAMQRDIMERTLALEAAAAASSELLRRVVADGGRVALAERQLAVVRAREEQLIGATRTALPEVTGPLYFPGEEAMRPAASALAPQGSADDPW